MKKLLLSVVAMLFAATSYAQNGLVATLSHGTDLKMFYGVNALKEAVAQAESSDVINLSDGSFNATNITKGITLRGAGIDSNAPTYIVGDFTIEIPEDDANRFMMEGIRCTHTMATKGTFSYPYFVRCQFNRVTNAKENDAVTNIVFFSCKITGQTNYGANDTYSFVNCYLGETCQYQNATATFSNCVIYCSNVAYMGQSQAFNCIFVSPNRANWVLPNTAQATNCVCANYYQSIFRDVAVKPNCDVVNREDMFKTFTDTYSDEETFELTDAFIANYKGTDGEQIGLYGGLQYNSTPSYPLITTMNVDKQTNTEGKLGVTIEISK